MPCSMGLSRFSMTGSMLLETTRKRVRREYPGSSPHRLFDNFRRYSHGVPAATGVLVMNSTRTVLTGPGEPGELVAAGRGDQRIQSQLGEHLGGGGHLRAAADGVPQAALDHTPHGSRTAALQLGRDLAAQPVLLPGRPGGQKRLHDG